MEWSLSYAWQRRFFGTQPGTRRASIRDDALKYGFATAYTDTGHKRQTYAHATYADQNLAAKVLLAEFTPSRPPYWDGCLTGGRQGLMFAQQFPDMFNGIVAATPIRNSTDLMMAFV